MLQDKRTAVSQQQQQHHLVFYFILGIAVEIQSNTTTTAGQL
jgi:hypothetical protein